MVQNDDPNNPYTNPYLDSDLAMTIGKNRDNRKRINASRFLLHDKGSEAKTDNENTEDTT